MPELITLGETMVCFTPFGNETLQYGHNFEKRLAGAESNVAIAMARLGHSSGWISRLGEDPFGLYIRNAIRGEGVDVSQVSFTRAHPTGLMFKEISHSHDPHITYYRRNSAASQILPKDISPDYFDGCKIFHTTGINAALENESFSTMKAAISIAKSKGCLISFDPNIRLKLCNVSKIKEPLVEILRLTDIALLGIDEAEILFSRTDTQEILSALFKLGITYAGLKLSDQGAVVAINNEQFYAPPFSVKKVDSVGAGDAFNAGFLSGLLEGRTLDKCAEYGNAMGALAVTSRGDYESLPTKQELCSFIEGKQTITR